MKKIYLFVVLLFVTQFSFAQKHSVLIGTDFPTQYTIGYNIEYGTLSSQIQAGFLTKPYDNLILDIIEGFGADPNIIEIIRDAYQKGAVFTVKQQYHLKKMYFGVYAQYYNLSAEGVPLDIVQSYYGVDLTSSWSSIPLIPTALDFGNEITKIELKSKLWQVGLLIGRRFEFSNPKLELRTEFSMSKNISSSNLFSSQTPYPQSLFDDMDADIQETYKNYAYIPSVNIYLAYRF